MKVPLPRSILTQGKVCKGSSRLHSSHLSLLHKANQKSTGNMSMGYYKPLTQALIEAEYCSKMILYGLKGIKKKIY